VSDSAACDPLRCVASGPAEAYVSSHGDQGPHFVEAVNEAVFAADGPAAVDSITRVRHEQNVRHGATYGNVDDRYHIEWFYEGSNDSVCYQVILKEGKILLIHTSKFFQSQREKDGSLPFYWRPEQQTPRGGAEEPMRLFMSSDVEWDTQPTLSAVKGHQNDNGDATSAVGSPVSPAKSDDANKVEVSAVTGSPVPSMGNT